MADFHCIFRMSAKKYARSKCEFITDVTAFAVGKVVRTERASAVMAGGTARTVSWRKVHGRKRRRNLFAADRSRLNDVAARAVHSGTAMSGMAEVDLKCICEFRSSDEFP
jgi:hypothetical protein